MKGVPAEVCDTCAEYYLDNAVAQKVYMQAEEAVKRHAEVEIVRYSA
jgi:hypothetical protein